MSRPVRQTARLRYGRVSLPGARYFLTVCTHRRVPALLASSERDRCLTALRILHENGDADVLAAVVMPDHIHLLFALGEKLALGQVMAKFKTLTRDRGRVPWRWQENGFEHRLRPEEETEAYGFYGFMNSYSAGLLTMEKTWPGWFCPQPERFRFLAGLSADGTPPREWLNEIKSSSLRLTTGE